MAGRWGDEGPPTDAYSRVTNAERFRPLHVRAVELLEDLERRFVVVRRESIGGVLAGLEGESPARASVELVPEPDLQAPLRVAFTGFPALRVRVGRWLELAFPHCGCDACDENAEESWESFDQLVEAVVGGDLWERIDLGLFGDGWYLHSTNSDRERFASRSRNSREALKAWIAPYPDREVFWQPWSER